MFGLAVRVGPSGFGLVWGSWAPGEGWRLELVRILLGRALGHFIFSLIGLKRILFTNFFQKLLKPHLVWV